MSDRPVFPMQFDRLVGAKHAVLGLHFSAQNPLGAPQEAKEAAEGS